jgi:N-acetylmuramoyl-L-alanine amidase
MTKWTHRRRARHWSRLSDSFPVAVVVVSLMVVVFAETPEVGAQAAGAQAAGAQAAGAQAAGAITLRGIEGARVGDSPAFAASTSVCAVVSPPNADGISTIVDGGAIRLVAFRSKRYQTASGVRVGMSADQVVAAYGKKVTKNARGLLFTPASQADANLRLEFEIARKTVTVIRVGEADYLGGCPSGASASTLKPATSAPLAPLAPLAPPAESAPPGTLDGSDRIIVLDPGHNGANGRNTSKINRLVDAGGFKKACNTVGATSVSGLTEADFNWSVTQMAKNALEAQSWKVVLTRPDNEGWGPCVDERGKKPGAVGASLMISIHADGGPSSGRGFHVIYPSAERARNADIARQSKELAAIVRDALVDSGLDPSTYIGRSGLSERNDLGTLNLAAVPAVIIESGNMNNAADDKLLTSSEFQSRIATAVAASASTWSKR